MFVFKPSDSFHQFQRHCEQIERTGDKAELKDYVAVALEAKKMWLNDRTMALQDAHKAYSDTKTRWRKNPLAYNPYLEKSLRAQVDEASLQKQGAEVDWQGIRRYQQQMEDETLWPGPKDAA